MTHDSGRDICVRCRHPRPLHSNAHTACRARGCKSGPEGQPCQGFINDAGEQSPAGERDSVLIPSFIPPAATAV